MAIGYRAGATAINGAVCGKPAGTASGDVLVAHVYCGSAAVTVTGPAGWVKQARATSGTIPVEATVWTLVAGGSEPTTYTWAATGGNYTDVSIDGYTGVDNTTPMDAAAVIQANASSGAPVSPSITTATANAWAVLGMFVGNATITAPAGTSQRENFDSSMGEADILEASAGPTGTFAWTVAAAQVTVTSTVALRPVGAPAGLPPGLGPAEHMQPAQTMPIGW